MAAESSQLLLDQPADYGRRMHGRDPYHRAVAASVRLIPPINDLSIRRAACWRSGSAHTPSTG